MFRLGTHLATFMAILSAFFAAFWTSSAVPSMPSTTAFPRNIAARPTMDTASKLVAATKCSTVALDGVPPECAGAAPAAGARGKRTTPGDLDGGSDVNVLTTSPMAEKALETPQSSQSCVRDGRGGWMDRVSRISRRGRFGDGVRGVGVGGWGMAHLHVHGLRGREVLRVALGKIGCFDRDTRGGGTVRRRGGLEARRDAVVRGGVRTRNDDGVSRFRHRGTHPM